MKDKLSNISQRTWVRIILICILMIIVAISIAGEKVAINRGIGWDGESYFTTMRSFISMIKHHGYDQYAIRRIMPWGLTNIICAIVGINVTRNVAIASGVIYNVIALALSVFYFFRISNLKQWKIETEVIGFAFVFYSFLVLKMLGYYPILSDVFGMTLGLMLCYYFFANKKWALIICGFLGATLWPSSPVCAFALAFFPRKELTYASQTENKYNKYLLNGLYILIASLPVLFIIQGLIEYHGHIMLAMRAICPLTIPVSEWIIPLSCLCSCLFYYYLVSAFKISLPQVIKENFTGKSVWYNYVLFVVCILSISVIGKILANSNPGTLTPLLTIKWIVMTSMTDPFVFVENYFVYYGLAYILILIFWKDLAKIIMNQGLGYLFVVALWVLFSIRPEARVSILYWIFPVMALLMYIDTKNIRKSATGYAVISSLIFSHFWFPFNVPNMEKYLAWENYANYTKFPAQRYFLNHGHWQSHEMYYVLTILTIIIGIVVYYGIKQKWFVRNVNQGYDSLA